MVGMSVLWRQVGKGTTIFIIIIGNNYDNKLTIIARKKFEIPST